MVLSRERLDKGLGRGENKPMTEFETATIAFQNASLWATYVQAGVAGLVGLSNVV